MAERTVAEIAAQLWCEPQHAGKEMDVDLALSIAAVIQAERDLREAAERERDGIAAGIVWLAHAVMEATGAAKSIALLDRQYVVDHVVALRKERDELRLTLAAARAALEPFAEAAVNPKAGISMEYLRNAQTVMLAMQAAEEKS